MNATITDLLVEHALGSPSYGELMLRAASRIADLERVVTELRQYADLKLQQHRQDYDEEHCMVQTALRMIALADAALTTPATGGAR